VWKEDGMFFLRERERKREKRIIMIEKRKYLALSPRGERV
jgi:hypothetical protein